MAEAASNLMQMRMAEKGVGGNYPATLDRAAQKALPDEVARRIAAHKDKTTAH